LDEAVGVWRNLPDTATLAQSELGKAAAKLLQTANGQPVMIADRDRVVDWTRL
jgi:hypothetical protein